MAPSVDVRLLGDFRFACGDELLTSLGSRRLQSLVAYLLLHRHAPQSRQYLAFCLWPDSSDKQARTNLRQLLHHLRAAIPDADHYLSYETQTVQWRPDVRLTLDVTEFERAVDRANNLAENESLVALEEAAKWYRGKLLPDCYEEWIEPERERLHQMHITALNRLIRVNEARRDYRSAIETAHRLLQQDHLQEAAYRDLMRLHALNADRAGALKVYQQCEDVLRREFGVPPSRSTQDLFESIRDTSYLHKPLVGEGAGTPVEKVPLVGRNDEWQLLLNAWRSVSEGKAHFIFVEGEAGIGKTRLSEELLSWAATQGIPTARAHCYAAEGRLAYSPITEWLRGKPLQYALTQLEAVWLTEIARAVPELLVRQPELPSPDRMTRGWQRRRFFEALARAVSAAKKPLVLLIDDLQWCDRGTLEWLHYLLRHDETNQLLIIGTVRSEEVEPEHPLELLRLDLRQNGSSTEIHLGPLDVDHTAELAAAVGSQELDAQSQSYLYRETEGNPLFVVEHVRAGLLSIAPASGSKDPSPQLVYPASLPAKVHAVITARLSQLSSPARDLAAVAATVGQALEFELLGEATGLDGNVVVTALEELGRRRIIDEREDGTYDFSHDKLREVAYHRISPPRRRLLHHQIARALESTHASEIDKVRGRIAVHYDCARRAIDAITNYKKAAEVARAVYADEEALSYLSRALALLEHIPKEQDRKERELGLLVSAGPSLGRVKGYTAQEVRDAYSRAYKLALELDKMGPLFPALWGLWSYHVVRAEITKALELGSQLLELSLSEQESSLRVAGHFSLGSSLFHQGRFQDARKQLESAITHYDRRQHRTNITFFAPDHSIFALSYLAHTLWHLGFVNKAADASDEALRRARQLSHPFSTAIALDYDAMLHQFRREPGAAQRSADAAVALCDEHNFSYYHGWATIMQGWACAQSGEIEKGIEQMHRGLNRLQQRGAFLRKPYYLSLLAEAYMALGQTDEAFARIKEARSTMDATGDCWIAPEIHRLTGECYLAKGNDTLRAEDEYRAALRIARSQQSRSLELRIAPSLHGGGQSQTQSLLKTVQ